MADSKMNDTASSQDFDESTRYFGRVKWFNNKAGYGFCTVVGNEGDERVGEDIFVHHTGVKVGSEQYKYLVQGEYVQFNLRSSDSTAALRLSLLTAGSRAVGAVKANLLENSARKKKAGAKAHLEQLEQSRKEMLHE